jgi:lysophospholipase L1-like esterase
MMKTILIFFLSISTLSACTKKTEPMFSNTTTTTPPVTTTPKDTLTYLALGDSYTIGQSVSAQESFPYQLSTMLPGYKVAEPKIIARTGWITQQLIDAIAGSDINGKTYDVVTLLIGVNDQYGGYSKSDYRVKFAAVLNTAIKFAGGKKDHVFVLSIPDYGVTPYAHGNDAVIGPEIDQFNAINLEETNKLSVTYVNITPISKGAGADLTLLANDGLHPSAKMYNVWVQKLVPEILLNLKSK